MWHCVEERSKSIDDFGKYDRKVLFDNIYANRNALQMNSPLDYGQMGDKVVFCDNTLVREANFVCNSKNSNLTPKDIVAKLLSSERELRIFCRSHKIGKPESQPVFSLVIDAYDFLRSKVPVSSHISNTQSPVRKRPIENVSHSSENRPKIPRISPYPEVADLQIKSADEPESSAQFFTADHFQLPEENQHSMHIENTNGNNFGNNTGQGFRQTTGQEFGQQMIGQDFGQGTQIISCKTEVIDNVEDDDVAVINLNEDDSSLAPTSSSNIINTSLLSNHAYPAVNQNVFENLDKPTLYKIRQQAPGRLTFKTDEKIEKLHPKTYDHLFLDNIPTPFYRCLQCTAQNYPVKYFKFGYPGIKKNMPKSHLNTHHLKKKIPSNLSFEPEVIDVQSLHEKIRRYKEIQDRKMAMIVEHDNKRIFAAPEPKPNNSLNN